MNKDLDAIERLLLKSHTNLDEQISSLSRAVRYCLEDESFKALPGLLKEKMGIEVIGRLKRDFVQIGTGKYLEVNIWGKAREGKKECLVIGEAKTQLKRKDVDGFMKKAEELKRYFFQDQVMILVTYQTSPQVQEYAKSKGIHIFFSYEF